MQSKLAKGRFTKDIANKTGRRTHDRENAALAKASSPPKTAGTEPTPCSKTSTESIITTSIAKSSERKEKGNANAPIEKKKEEKEGKQNQSKKPPEVVSIPSDEESHCEFLINEKPKETSQGSARTGPLTQTTSANTSATPMEADVQHAIEIEQQEEVLEAPQIMEVSVATPEELSTQVVRTPTPTLAHTYSTMVCPSLPTVAPIY